MNDADNRKVLIEKLRAGISAITDSSAPAQPDEPPEPIVEPSEIETVIPGRNVQTPYGPCYVAEADFDLSTFHGLRRLRESLDTDLPLLADPMKISIPDDLRFTDALFLDTETTGVLAAGTMGFMIGLGFFRDNVFCIRQIFLRDYMEERAGLHLLGEYAQGRSILFTFNGRNFDVPLLDMRLAQNRFRWRLADMPHGDLLLPARRIWKHALPDCRLGSLEEAVLGFRRTGDIPGFEIPDLYFTYQRERNARKLKAVFDHNLYDVLSLVLLPKEMAIRFPEKPQLALPPLEKFALANYWLNRNAREIAEQYYESALPLLRGEPRNKTLRALSLLFRGKGEWEPALECWRELTDRCPEELFAYQELAKYYEHGAKDFDEALAWVDRAQENVVFPGYNARKGWEHRRKRIELKKSRQS